ncbi:hypothetical protein I3760_15G080400 [Carya illinoinensis]|uniref:Uncharacterized protein n=1 Tax=Carya illinoinensis TaxID=32201 RepID=A0A8T1N5G6_CARIL|nr:hypothetical protein I3760_15G080400 [Carya illinoinensis]KAG6626909.1 hypothetical protein CIPAW_15G085200 [Carya illinoinensis]
MSFAGGWRLMCSTLVVLLILSVLQIWVCCEYSCQASAIRILPAGNGSMAKLRRKESSISHGSVDKKSKEELLHKYFNGKTFGFSNMSSDKGFEENKRKVPSCPDPLHN